jgi:hypothetical protein
MRVAGYRRLPEIGNTLKGTKPRKEYTWTVFPKETHSGVSDDIGDTLQGSPSLREEQRRFVRSGRAMMWQPSKSSQTGSFPAPGEATTKRIRANPIGATTLPFDKYSER